MSVSIEQTQRRKIRDGFFFLSFRSILVNAMRILSIYLLSRWMDSTGYGIYGILNSYIATAMFFCDVGIGGALIQQQEEPSSEQLRNCAGINVGLASLIAVVFWLAAPGVSAHHGLGTAGTWMFRILACLLPIYAARGVYRVVLDRGLRFKTSGTVELLESIGMYAVQLAVAFLGGGAWSFVGGNITRAFAGSVLLLRQTRLFFLPTLKWSVLKPLVRFGLGFQLNAMVPALRNLVIPLVMAHFLSVADVGLVTWALAIAFFPQVLVLNLNQVLFSGLARAQNSKEEFGRLASRSLELTILGVGYLYGVLAVIVPFAIVWIFQPKWHAAAGVISVAFLASGLDALRSAGGSVFNAIGIPMRRFRIETIALVVEYAAVFLGLKFWGLKSYFWCISLVFLVMLIWTYWELRRHLRAEVFRRLMAVAISVLVSMIAIYPFAGWIPRLVVFHGVFVAGVLLFHRSSRNDFVWAFSQVKNLIVLLRPSLAK